MAKARVYTDSAGKIPTRKQIQLLRDTAASMRRLRHELHYSQGKWSTRNECGTAGCVAFRIVLTAGFRPVPNIYFGENEHCCIGPNNQWLDIQASAKQLTGLSYAQISLLFHGSPSEKWPEPFGQRWQDAYRGWCRGYADAITGKEVHPKKPERPSRIAADYLDWLAHGSEVRLKAAIRLGRKRASSRSHSR